MVKLLERLFDSFVSAIAYGFLRYQDHGTKRPKHTHRSMPKSRRPLSLQKTLTDIFLIYNRIKRKAAKLKRMTMEINDKRVNSVRAIKTVELKVRMCCTGCERVVKEAIYKLKGIDSVTVELEMEKVTVIGYVDRSKVLKAVRRAGKRAEFWPYPTPPLYFTSSSHYFKDMTSEYRKSYNYWRHGYNEAHRHGLLPVTHRGDDKISNMFNDDDVNACRVM